MSKNLELLKELEKQGEKNFEVKNNTLYLDGKKYSGIFYEEVERDITKYYPYERIIFINENYYENGRNKRSIIYFDDGKIREKRIYQENFYFLEKIIEYWQNGNIKMKIVFQENSTYVRELIKYRSNKTIEEKRSYLENLPYKNEKILYRLDGSIYIYENDLSKRFRLQKRRNILWTKWKYREKNNLPRGYVLL